MANHITRNENGAGQLTVETKLPQSTDEQTVTIAPVELRTHLGASPEGLTQTEAQHHLAQDGYDELPETKTHPIFRFLSYFWGPIPWLIEMAAILSALARRWEDAGIIVALLLVNVHLGFWEEYQAGYIIATLKEILA